ncbi:MAG: hypothetical protein IT385_07500 [Deltaproteobacteria bacterium]|nr:hypothetical protein [Deltaproteobacteria bacterium]
MLVYVITFLWCIPSGFFWFMNGEAMVVLQVTQNPEAAPWLIALVATVAQFLGYTGLYQFAGVVLTRFQFVQRAVDKVKSKVSLQGGWGTYTVFATGGLCGIPPLLALFTLYGSARAGPLPRLLMVAMPMRVVWYLGWAYAPDALRGVFG